jgi:hypothetical protein
MLAIKTNGVLRKSEERRHDEYSSHDRFGFVPE